MRVFGEGFRTGNEAIVDELFSPEVEHQSGRTRTAALQHVKDAIANVHSIAPDLACTIKAPGHRRRPDLDAGPCPRHGDRPVLRPAKRRPASP